MACPATHSHVVRIPTWLCGQPPVQLGAMQVEVPIKASPWRKPQHNKPTRLHLHLLYSAHRSSSARQHWRAAAPLRSAGSPAADSSGPHCDTPTTNTCIRCAEDSSLMHRSLTPQSQLRMAQRGHCSMQHAFAWCVLLAQPRCQQPLPCTLRREGQVPSKARCSSNAQHNKPTTTKHLTQCSVNSDLCRKCNDTLPLPSTGCPAAGTAAAAAAAAPAAPTAPAAATRPAGSAAVPAAAPAP